MDAALPQGHFPAGSVGPEHLRRLVRDEARPWARGLAARLALRPMLKPARLPIPVTANDGSLAPGLHVLAQTCTGMGLLVVDDADTDGGLEKVEAISNPRIRILGSTVNTGRATAAQWVYDAALGEYVAVLGADDQMQPERLARPVAFMETHREVGISGTAYLVTGSADRIGQWPAEDAECRASLLFDDPLWHGSANMRRNMVEAHGLRCNPNWLWPGMDCFPSTPMHSMQTCPNH